MFLQVQELVAVLACEPGCHGVQRGAKKDGGYLAYVTSKFANNLLVVDPDPNNDGDGSDAHITGSVVLTKAFNTVTDDRVIGYSGQCGQGVLTVPNVYEGWIQQIAEQCSNNNGNFKNKFCGREVIDYLKALTEEQLDPLGS